MAHRARFPCNVFGGRESANSSLSVSGLRRLAGIRPRFGLAIVLLPAATGRVLRRSIGGRRAGLSGAAQWVVAYATAALTSALIWGTLLIMARAKARVGHSLAAALVRFGGRSRSASQRYFYDQYDTYLNLDAALFGLSFPASLTRAIGAKRRALRPAATPVALLPSMLRWWRRA